MPSSRTGPCWGPAPTGLLASRREFAFVPRTMRSGSDVPSSKSRAASSRSASGRLGFASRSVVSTMTVRSGQFILGAKDHQAGHWICSACQFEGLERIGLLHRTPLEPSQVTPDALFFTVTSGLGGNIVATG